MATTIEVPLVQGGNTAPYELPETLKVWQGDAPPAKHCMFRILNTRDGDTRVVWNADSLGEIHDAKRMFDDMVAKGLVPHRVDSRGKKSGEIMTEFDPTAEEIIFAPIALARGG